MPKRNKPRRQQMLVLSLVDGLQKNEPQAKVVPFTRVVTLFVPRRLAAHRRENAREVLNEVNIKIVQRGYIEHDGQILLNPISPTVELEMIDDWGCASEEEVSRRAELGMMGISENAILEFETRPWGPEQARYFGCENPYQLSENPGEYSYWHVQLRLSTPILAPGEFILALLHGGRDDAYFYCPCHEASVVYTTRHRFICMGCGFLHSVPASPLTIQPATLLSGKDWEDYFDPGGAKSEDEVNLTMIDFQDIENAQMIWTTNQWEEARHRFLFFSRSTPQEIEKAIRGTEMDPSIFLNAGWNPEAIAPPVAHQIADDSVEVDLVENAMHSLCVGVRFYLAAKHESSALVNAIPALFRSVELLLKQRLEHADARALQDQPSNPIVLARLKAAGVLITSAEESIITRLRKLRNNLQHGTARFNQRAGLKVCRSSLIFLDRFMDAELSIHLGADIPETDWIYLLEIPEIAATATRVTNVMLERANQQKSTTIEKCPRCCHDAMVRPHPNTGISCWYCGHCPIVDDDNMEDSLTRK